MSYKTFERELSEVYDVDLRSMNNTFILIFYSEARPGDAPCRELGNYIPCIPTNLATRTLRIPEAELHSSLLKLVLLHV